MDLADRTYEYFERVRRDVFENDPASNPALAVEVVEFSEVGGAPSLVLITPWTLNGMVFGDLPGFPGSLTIGGKGYPVFTNTLEEVGTYQSVNLVSDVSSLENQEAARRAARAFVKPFRTAIAKVQEQAQIEDPGRRGLLRGLIRPDEIGHPGR